MTYHFEHVVGQKGGCIAQGCMPISLWKQIVSHFYIALSTKGITDVILRCNKSQMRAIVVTMEFSFDYHLGYV